VGSGQVSGAGNVSGVVPSDVRSQRRYDHFCLIARSLEAVGERWGLLIVRDLLYGPRRFSDLERSCYGITPRQLSARLRQLEEVGIVAREGKGRSTRYRLTQAGGELRPVVDGLLRWGLHHAREVPGPDDVVRGPHILDGTRIYLSDSNPPVRSPLAWTWRFPGDPQTITFEAGAWELSSGEPERPDVAIETSPRDWAAVVMGGRPADPAVRLIGSPARIAEFESVFGLTPAAGVQSPHRQPGGVTPSRSPSRRPADRRR
jgi:DNA-binding HxlR family transcriptional regulator